MFKDFPLQKITENARNSRIITCNLWVGLTCSTRAQPVVISLPGIRSQHYKVSQITTMDASNAGLGSQSLH